MRLIGFGVLAVLAACAGKSAAPAGGDAGSTSAATSSCAPGAALAGASYDLSKSKFARADGALHVAPNGSEGASLNGGAPEQSLPPFSSDTTILRQHAIDYYVGMGVDPCQIARAGISSGGSGGGPTTGGSSSGVTVTNYMVELQRAVDGIPVAQSLANVDFRAGDVTVFEAFYWPTIPADVVANARALRDRLSDPAQLAAYRAKLPATWQGEGEVLILHTSEFSQAPFRAVAAWWVNATGAMAGSMGFDENGVSVGQF